MTDTYDIAIVGAGMAGASLAAECAAHASVVMLEAEDTPGYHTTGRSAAFWEELYGGPALVPLSRASRPYLQEKGVLSPRGALYIAREEEAPRLNAFGKRFEGSGAHFERVGRAEMAQRVPGLSEAWTHAIWQPDCADIDVASLHQHYLGLAKDRVAQLRCGARLNSAARNGDTWDIDMGKGGQIGARTLVNAAGAWADIVAEAAGVPAIGIQPLRRTVAVLRTDPPAPADMPLTLDISGHFYFRPDGGRLWLSPHDETPSELCDAAPDDLDVAQAIDRWEQVLEWKLERVEHRWAGLRSFTPDRAPAFGFDPRAKGFFWFAGQGGTGIQTAPAAARLGAQLLLGLDRDEMTAGIEAAPFDPARFRN